MATTTASFPSSLTFRVGQAQQLNWILTDSAGDPISNATVSATLYTNRSLSNPSAQPGTADTVFQNISLIETATAGTYSGGIPVTFSPSSAAQNYIVVISAAGTSFGSSAWSVPAVVIFPENVIDLVNLDQVKDYLGLQTTNTDDDGLIQLLISGFSQFVLNKTGIKSFNSTSSYTDTYDGNGNQRLFLRQYPIVSLTSVTIGYYSCPISTSFGVPGVFVEDSRKSIAFRTAVGAFNPPQSIYPYSFTPGQGNIVVVYSAGYTFVPFDLQEMAMKVVAINYKRKDTIDQANKSITSGGGTAGVLRYRDWAMPPECMETLRYYMRRAHT